MCSAISSPFLLGLGSNPVREAVRQFRTSVKVTAPRLIHHGFCLHKGAFCDARYNWSPPLLPLSCVCGSSFQVDHALSCHHGSFPSIRHNELRDSTAHLLNHSLLEALESFQAELGLVLKLPKFTSNTIPLLVLN